MSASAPQPWRPVQRLLGLIADLRLAIVLLLLIAVASGIGTAIPQQESEALYHQRYDPSPWLGLLHGNGVLALQLDHVYSSGWFLALLAWLGLSLLLCSWRRQWPALAASLRWIDYRSPRQLSKLSVAQTLVSPDAQATLERLEQELRRQGWNLQRQPDRLAARRGVAGRLGPLLVHAGLVVLMVGAAWGALGGQRLEQFLAPGRELELVDSRGRTQLTVALDDFAIERDPAGRPEQFRSQLRLIPPAAAGSEAGAAKDAAAAEASPGTADRAGDTTTQAETPGSGRTPALRRPDSGVLEAEISVNHPLRHRGMTLYQADWSLAALNVQLGRSPVLQLPLQSLPQLGDQVWGVVLPTRPDGSEPVLLTLASEQGPIQVFGSDGTRLAQLAPGGAAEEVRGLPIRVASVLPASGILLKRDPGVPLVYAGFAIALLGGGLSLVATRQLWAIAEPAAGRLHVAGLCNRNLTAFGAELPQLLSRVAADRG
jgi:cytochrome c biogenesis protein